MIELGQTEPICRIVTDTGPNTIYKDKAGKYYNYVHGYNGFSITLYPLKNMKAVEKEMRKAIECCEYIHEEGRWGEVIKNTKK